MVSGVKEWRRLIDGRGRSAGRSVLEHVRDGHTRSFGWRGGQVIETERGEAERSLTLEHRSLHSGAECKQFAAEVRLDLKLVEQVEKIGIDLLGCACGGIGFRSGSLIIERLGLVLAKKSTATLASTAEAFLGAERGAELGARRSLGVVRRVATKTESGIYGDRLR